MSIVAISDLTENGCDVWKLDVLLMQKIGMEVGTLQLWRITTGALRALGSCEVEEGMEKLLRAKIASFPEECALEP